LLIAEAGEVKEGRLLQVGGLEGDEGVFSRSDFEADGTVDGDREDGTAVVVDVLAKEVDPTGGEDG
jgi:hypothetical protein